MSGLASVLCQERHEPRTHIRLGGSGGDGLQAPAVLHHITRTPMVVGGRVGGDLKARSLAVSVWLTGRPTCRNQSEHDQPSALDEM